MWSKRYQRLWLSLLVVTGAAGLLPGAMGQTTSDGASVESGAEQARMIGRALEAGRLTEAEAEARRAVKRAPTNALLQLRLAQVDLSLAIQLDRQLGELAEDIAFDRALTLGLQRLRDSSAPIAETDPATIAAIREDYSDAAENLLTNSVMQTIARFQRRVRDRVAESESLLGRRSHALSGAMAALKEARRLGEQSTELELTDLWAQGIVLLWRQEGVKQETLAARAASNAATPGQEAEKSDSPLKQYLIELEKAIAPFAGVRVETVLHSAAELAHRRSSDPVALAGAADLIVAVAGISGRPDPLRLHLLATLDHRYLKNIAQLNPETSRASREAARQIYIQARDAQHPDVVAAPSAVALQLYRQALQQDPKASLPNLRLRLYLLQVTFDPEQARRMLEELKRHHPGNAAVALEQARTSFLLDGKPAEALAYCREAARLSRFSRSYLVAVPAPLRPALKLQRELRQWIQEAWPGYAWLFVTLEDIQHAQREASAQMEMRLLRLKLAERLCQAPDYPDQAQGVHQKSLILAEMSELLDQLPAEQGIRLQLLREEHARSFEDFPRERTALVLTEGGLSYAGLPNLNPLLLDQKGYKLWMHASGMLVLGVRKR